MSKKTDSHIPRLGPVCPIPGCNHRFATAGSRGWFPHVGEMSLHPKWHPNIEDRNRRGHLFKEEFPEFFEHVPVPPPATSSGTRKAVVVNGVPAPRISVSAGGVFRCPLKGCEHVFEKGIEGWEEHVSNFENHPDYLPDVRSPKMRLATFEERDFPGWFRQAGHNGSVSLYPYRAIAQGD